MLPTIVAGNPAIKMLGELALRANDLDAMVAFYRDIVGFEVYSDLRPLLVFLRIADGVEGHPQLLGIFDRSTEVGQATTTLDHFAFSIDVSDYESEKARLESLGVGVVTKEFPGFHWRSLFFYDPEGNTVEFVAYDASVTE
jgi:catechol 2,3-dioxygenase-like lactoylglutathione lyase family enzyme